MDDCQTVPINIYALNMLISILPIVVFLVVIGFVDYQLFFKQRKMVFNGFSEADITYGKVKYLDLGPKDHNAVLFSKGGGSGIDLVTAFDWLIDGGYRIIAINSPRYYGMPVNVYY